MTLCFILIAVTLTGCTFTVRVISTGTSGYPSGSTVSSTHTVMRISSPFVGHQTVEIFDQFPDGKYGALSLQKRMQRTALREPYLLPILHRAKGIQKNNSRCARLSC